jgi:hypothetical protein|tara:strand:- start:114 stop:455 length:342 start_codon:yes stop_codon:yes gene_type:complete
MAIQLLDKKLVMKPRRSSMVKVEKQLDIVENYDSDSENIYQEPRADKFDEIIGLLKQGNVYGEKDNITLGAVDVPIEKQIAIDKVSTKGLKSETYKNDSKSKLDKLRKLRRGN